MIDIYIMYKHLRFVENDNMATDIRQYAASSTDAILKLFNILHELTKWSRFETVCLVWNSQ